MTRVWTRHRMLSLLVAYAAAACFGSAVYASSQVLLERVHPTKGAPSRDLEADVAWVPIMKKPGGSICVGKDDRSTCLRSTANQAELDHFIVGMTRVIEIYRQAGIGKTDPSQNFEKN